MVKYVYDAWGNHKAYAVNTQTEVETLIYDSVTKTVVTGYENNIGILNPIRYRGYYFDIETGLYYLQTRYYDPQVGRFISPDSVDFLDPDSINGLNLYAYCGNNPIMYTDPEGHKPKLWQWRYYMKKIKLYQTVKLITDKYEESGLKKGTLGTILEIYDKKNFEIEWYDSLGNVIYMCAFNIDDFEIIN